MAKDCDVLIVGGGLNGPVLALALAQGGISSLVLDARPAEVRADPEFDGRAYALALASRRMLEALGLWPGIAPKAQAISEIRISQGRAGEGAGRFWLHFDGNEIDEGPMGHIVEDRFLRAAIAAAVEAEPLVGTRNGVAVVGQATGSGRANVTLADGAELSGALLVACDGRDSQVARRAGIARRGRGYGQSSLVCAIEHERPHRGIAHQFFMPAGPLAILPLPGNRSSIVWTETTERAAAISRLDAAGYLAELRPRFGDFLGEIGLAGGRYSYPLALSLAERLTDARLALVGDAAHGIHPLAGQGLNLGLRDVATLAEVLVTAHRRGEDIGAADVLARYARWRRFDITAMAAMTDGLNRLFSNDNPLLRLGRGLGLAAVARLPALRRTLIAEAAGATGDLPVLLRGRPL
ncbi:UbiH/UbiF/VisC/COQ6 family ubiquinone biosynthesis hydroxylase [Amaricoccus sp.]|uniref:UbiH/UbiF/VisC/COQ6 family ubiquinone biosynthesis hydroxylase n=1 Tax=Amaricoccus sp. TaxID=1872485 RepID=UPI002612DA46|nr:UbiH/UbiF/VisC/COQ6 family ubiquinone biosynthesis hydroxylase [Amaricoccus sp.]HRO12054.1 UbiH/UbiF/VisC/COQ6 family ubiquinone biosynthesis hydroxylase [Amaricoccus sp.]